MKMPAMTKGWPPARRRAQAARMRAQKPWLRSTGPRTANGKARSRLNGYKHGLRSQAMRRLKSLLREQRRFMREFVVGLPPFPRLNTEVTKDTERKPFFSAPSSSSVPSVVKTFLSVILSESEGSSLG
jgi:hypothetical protein